MTAPKKAAADLRSARWFAPDDLRSFGHRSRMNQIGYDVAEFAGKPVIGIINTWSDFAQCHAHFKHRVEDVKRGVLQAGGFPVELPAISLSESTVKPTTMLYRNFLAMETEELIRSQPVDGVVLMGGCDKTTPGLILGAISVGVPAIFVPAGPSFAATGTASSSARAPMPGNTGTSGAPATSRRRTGLRCRRASNRSYGVCMTMGTASTMTGARRRAGAMPAGHVIDPGAGFQPCPHVLRCRPPRRRDGVGGPGARRASMTRGAFLNAINVAMAMGCSTNAVIHIIAMARRAGHDIGLEHFDAASRKVPVIANIRPSGEHLPDGGFLLRRGPARPDVAPQGPSRPRPDQRHGPDLGREPGRRQGLQRRRHSSASTRPIYNEGALAVLKGNLAPDGCVIKPSACAPKFLRHTGPCAGVRRLSGAQEGRRRPATST